MDFYERICTHLLEKGPKERFVHTIRYLEKHGSAAHAEWIRNHVYVPGKKQLYDASTIEENLRRRQPLRTITMHTEYWNPAFMKVNTAEHLMNFLTLEEYLELQIHVFRNVVQFALSKGRLSDLIVNGMKGNCFEMWMRSIQNWMKEQQPLHRYQGLADDDADDEDSVVVSFVQEGLIRYVDYFRPLLLSSSDDDTTDFMKLPAALRQAEPVCFFLCGQTLNSTKNTVPRGDPYFRCLIQNQSEFKEPIEMRDDILMAIQRKLSEF